MARGRTSSRRAGRSSGASRPRGSRAGKGPLRPPETYGRLSTRPLHVLVFLLPLLALYEIGSVLYLTDPTRHTVETIRAHRLLGGFFEAFGVGGFFLPGLLIIVVLLLWHVLERDRWKVRPQVLAMMLGESAVWTLPLLVLWQIVATAAPSSVADAPAAALAAGEPNALTAMSMPARLTISIGAGLYEELLFRLAGIAIVHAIAADIAKLKPSTSAVAAVAGTALAFALYHVNPGAGVDWVVFVFHFLAGLYLGWMYVWRGFGIVVATHALYDVVVLVLLPAGTGGVGGG